MPHSRAQATAAIVAAWLVTAVYYFLQYVLRSTPAVMMPELADGFGIAAAGVASLVGLFYWGYAPFHLVAGVAMDQLGPRRVVPIGAAVMGVGAIFFASGHAAIGGAGRFLQGAGGAFAMVGAAYIAVTYFPANRAATLIGATQMFGMAGGSAGQFVVGPLIAAGVAWSVVWLGLGIAAVAVAALLPFMLPAQHRRRDPAWLRKALGALALVFRNPQSLLCGAIAGLLFVPTTIFDMVWGVRYLQDAHGFDYPNAVLRSSTVPLGWIIGCPLLGLASDRLGRRKPVILGAALALFGCLAWILFGPREVLPPYMLGLVTGVVSGAAMLPYTVIKEANPPHVSGTTTGVIGFLNFTVTALLGPVFAGRLLTGGDTGGAGLPTYQAAFEPLLYGVGLAIVLTLLLKETGPAVAVAAAHARRRPPG
ncbi:MAG: MFS transporter [Deltaproteobacteria bacterium]|nr:MFS transporter [Deltaproteobacteria bacterium]